MSDCQATQIKQDVPADSILAKEYQSRKTILRGIEPAAVLYNITALLICGGFAPSGTRHPAPMNWRYPIHLDTPSLRLTSHVYLPVPNLKERIKYAG